MKLRTGTAILTLCTWSAFSCKTVNPNNSALLDGGGAADPLAGCKTTVDNNKENKDYRMLDRIAAKLDPENIKPEIIATRRTALKMAPSDNIIKELNSMGATLDATSGTYGPAQQNVDYTKEINSSPLFAPPELDAVTTELGSAEPSISTMDYAKSIADAIKGNGTGDDSTFVEANVKLRAIGLDAGTRAALNDPSILTPDINTKINAEAQALIADYNNLPADSNKPVIGDKVLQSASQTIASTGNTDIPNTMAQAIGGDVSMVKDINSIALTTNVLASVALGSTTDDAMKIVPDNYKALVPSDVIKANEATLNALKDRFNVDDLKNVSVQDTDIQTIKDKLFNSLSDAEKSAFANAGFNAEKYAAKVTERIKNFKR